MKKTLIIITLTVFIFSLFSACSEQELMNVDTFIERYNELWSGELKKTCMPMYEGEEYTEYIYDLSGILLTIQAKRSNMMMSSLELTSEKCDESFRNEATKLIITLTEKSNDETEKILDELFAKEKGFCSNTYTERKFTLLYICTSVGCKLSVNYNEQIPVQTTVTPESEKEYSTYKTREEAKLS